MTPSRAKRKFPQLSISAIKYCSIFYEGQHDDARTNLSIAQTAAVKGAVCLNYFEVIGLIKDPAVSNDRVLGVKARDVITNETYDISGKAVVFCGGPFTDEMRKLESPQAEDVIKGASGIHIVLPSYYSPSGIGLVDMSTSDGRFLFVLPWEGHVLVGTTDSPAKPSMRPRPTGKSP
jgi:glycerol-3-phosphate dehydrogenase